MKFTITLSLIACFSVSNLLAQGFGNTPTNWSIPQGGHTYSTIDYGYDALADVATGNNLGDQTWSILDMNGDGKPDLVVTAEVKTIPGFANQATVFGNVGSTYWKVYLNNGSGFASTPTSWSVPQGGHTYSTINYGFDALGYSAVSGSPIGDQSWSVIDINGDNKPDLVLTAESKAVSGFANQPTVYGNVGSTYWKVFLNNGSGFANTATNWAVPQGGRTYSTINYGFDSMGYSSEWGAPIGDQNWSILDVNGDAKPDLVVTAQAKQVTGLNNPATVFGTASAPYWKVFLNTGTGFSNTASTWNLPQGGRSYSSGNLSVSFGYDTFSYASAWGAPIGDQSWSILDVNGDAKPDLVVTAQSKQVAGLNNPSTVFGTVSAPFWKVFLNNGTGFSTTAATWNLPQGGHTYTSGSTTVNFGYDALNYSNTWGSPIGDRNWSVTDINGDHKPDLLVTAASIELASYANHSSVFGLPSSPRWIVYLNNGSGFGASGNWPVPQGGEWYNAVNFGFDALAESVQTNTVGCQSWSVLDMNNDSKPDLVVTAEMKEFATFSNQAITFGPTNAHYWKVYFNTGNLNSNDFTSEKDGFTVFPNPSTGKFEVRVPSASEITSIEVADLAGRTVLRQAGNNSVDLSAFPKGIYVLNITSGQASSSKKIVLK